MDKNNNIGKQKIRILTNIAKFPNLKSLKCDLEPNIQHCNQYTYYISKVIS